MDQYWGYKIIYLPKILKSPLLLPLDYSIRIIRTCIILARIRPSTLWVQAPPSFLLHLAYIYKIAQGKNARVVIDIHNSFLRRKWLAVPGISRLIPRMDAVVVHNESVRREFEEALGTQSNLFVLEDKALENSNDSRDDDKHEELSDAVLFPCSFDEDEPLQVVFEAARKAPSVRFIITGRHDGKISPDELAEAPPNVTLTGFLPLKKFDSLLSGVAAVLGLTTRENVQLSVANEAISLGKAMVLSDTPTLRSLFNGARFVRTLDPESIAAGVRDAISNRESYEAASRAGLLAKNLRWEQQAQELVRAIHE